MKKEFTLKELSTKLNIPTNTLRRYLLKGIEGEVYNKNIWNQKALREFLKKYDGNLEERLGCKVEDVECIKSLRSTTKTYIGLNQIQLNQTIILHNYSMETTLQLVDIKEVNGSELFTFYDNDKNEYKIYSLEQLSKKNIKFEAIEE